MQVAKDYVKVTEKTGVVTWKLEKAVIGDRVVIQPNLKSMMALSVLIVIDQVEIEIQILIIMIIVNINPSSKLMLIYLLI